MVIVVAIAVLIVCWCNKKKGSSCGLAAGRMYTAGKHAAVELADYSEFREAVDSADRAVVLAYAEWCGHCKQCKPAFVEAATKADCPFYMVDCEKAFDRTQMQELNIQGFPHIMLMSKGQVLRLHDGQRDVDGFLQFAAQ